MHNEQTWLRQLWLVLLGRRWEDNTSGLNRSSVSMGRATLASPQPGAVSFDLAGNIAEQIKAPEMEKREVGTGETGV